MTVVQGALDLVLRPLPAEITHLLQRAGAPPRLVAHLTLVHDVACQLVDALGQAFPGVCLARDEIVFGAATHDIGKAVVRDELSEPGHAHEARGRALLLELGMPAHLARFAVTHADLDRPEASLADALVALADKCWKGRRDEAVERRVAELLGPKVGLAEWEVVMRLDEVVERLAEGADERPRCGVPDRPR